MLPRERPAGKPTLLPGAHPLRRRWRGSAPPRATGRAAMTLADARVEEVANAVVAFAVTLSRTARRR